MSDIRLMCPKCRREFASDESWTCPDDGLPLYRPESIQRVGRTLGNYELVDILGEGGMGVVYKGRHVLLEKTVAVKILHDRFAVRREAVRQFMREARAASRIKHPNIVDVTDLGTDPSGLVYFVMEHLDGTSLDAILTRQGRLELFNSVNVIRQVAGALAAAHELKIIHRDLKPENIFLITRPGRRQVVRAIESGERREFVVEKEGDFDFVKLLDFGVAKILQDERVARDGDTALFCGTPYYMSPEQIAGGVIGPRSDIYSLGVVFYEMVTGYVPFDGGSPFEILDAHLRLPLVPPKERNPAVQIDDGTNQTIVRCLAKNPDERFPSMDELVGSLQNCFTDRVFLRDAHRLPGAAEAGIVKPEVIEVTQKIRPSKRPGVIPKSPRAGKLTEELSQLFTRGLSAPPPADPAAAEKPSTPRLVIAEPAAEEPLLLERPAKPRKTTPPGATPNPGSPPAVGDPAEGEVQLLVPKLPKKPRAAVVGTPVGSEAARADEKAGKTIRTSLYPAVAAEKEDRRRRALEETSPIKRASTSPGFSVVPTKKDP
jgi:eukaryotic-like serine/threonine-protein kinase